MLAMPRAGSGNDVPSPIFGLDSSVVYPRGVVGHSTSGMPEARASLENGIFGSQPLSSGRKRKPTDKAAESWGGASGLYSAKPPVSPPVAKTGDGSRMQYPTKAPVQTDERNTAGNTLKFAPIQPGPLCKNDRRMSSDGCFPDAPGDCLLGASRFGNNSPVTSILSSTTSPVVIESYTPLGLPNSRDSVGSCDRSFESAKSSSQPLSAFNNASPGVEPSPFELCCITPTHALFTSSAHKTGSSRQRDSKGFRQQSQAAGYARRPDHVSGQSADGLKYPQEQARQVRRRGRGAVGGFTMRQRGEADEGVRQRGGGEGEGFTAGGRHAGGARMMTAPPPAHQMGKVAAAAAAAAAAVGQMTYGSFTLSDTSVPSSKGKLGGGRGGEASAPWEGRIGGNSVAVAGGPGRASQGGSGGGGGTRAMAASPEADPVVLHTRASADGHERERRAASRYKGVTWDRVKRMWRVRLCLQGGTRQHVGYYMDEEEGAAAYVQALGLAKAQGLNVKNDGLERQQTSQATRYA